MKSAPDNLTVKDILELKSTQMLIVNPEYQRGVVWTQAQKKKLVDSVLRGYPIPLIYFHHIRHQAGGANNKLVSERYEVIDGQQRINALYEFHEGAFPLFDPVKDESQARFPDFIKKQPCPWGRLGFAELTDNLKEAFLNTPLQIVRIETHDQNEARDLFVRLQAGMPLTSQEKRDSWPGQFTDFVLKLGGKPGLARYPGHSFFNNLMKAQKAQDRGKFRQLAAQIAMLFFSRHLNGTFRDINAPAIDDFYYEHLGFDSGSDNAHRLWAILDKIVELLGNQKRSKIIGHEAIQLVMFVDSIWDDYTRSWEKSFADAFDQFRAKFAEGKLTRNDPRPNEYWLRYGYHTRVNSDRGDIIRRRHEFFSSKMCELLKIELKDPQRLFGSLEREAVYFRDKKRCAVCDSDVIWPEVEIHHVKEHARGGTTTLDNAALVHRHCHPKGAQATAQFAAKWKESMALKAKALLEENFMELDEEDEDDDASAA